MTDPFKIIEPTVISFSGGRTSAYMLWRVLQSNNGMPPEAIVCFANTGKEEEATLQFVHDCETRWNVPIVWLEFQFSEHVKDRFKVVDFETASRKGEPFEALIKSRKFLPNSMMRFCTSELKVLTIDRYLKSIAFGEYVTMVGIRADEPRRVAKMKNNKDEKITPLATEKVMKEDVWNFWDEHDFDLNLVKTSGASNCDLCFLKGGSIIRSLINEKPERAIWWAEMEEFVGGNFRKDRPSYRELMDYQNRQATIFGDESISCFCGD